VAVSENHLTLDFGLRKVTSARRPRLGVAAGSTRWFSRCSAAYYPLRKNESGGLAVGCQP
jgi:hypothetical protein